MLVNSIRCCGRGAVWFTKRRIVADVLLLAINRRIDHPAHNVGKFPVATSCDDDARLVYHRCLGTVESLPLKVEDIELATVSKMENFVGKNSVASSVQVIVQK